MCIEIICVISTDEDEDIRRVLPRKVGTIEGYSRIAVDIEVSNRPEGDADVVTVYFNVPTSRLHSSKFILHCTGVYSGELYLKVPASGTAYRGVRK